MQPNIKRRVVAKGIHRKKHKTVEDIAQEKGISVAECKLILGRYTKKPDLWEIFKTDLKWFAASEGVSPYSAEMLIKRLSKKEVTLETLREFKRLLIDYKKEVDDIIGERLTKVSENFA